MNATALAEANPVNNTRASVARISVVFGLLIAILAFLFIRAPPARSFGIASVIGGVATFLINKLLLRWDNYDSLEGARDERALAQAANEKEWNRLLAARVAATRATTASDRDLAATKLATVAEMAGEAVWDERARERARAREAQG